MSRITTAWSALSRDRRLAALAALGLLVSMFFPWYEKNAVVGRGFVSDTVSAFGAVSFVEAAVFLVAAGVLVLLFARAEQRDFELPGGDGTVIFGAGLWAALLIFYRVFDRPDVSGPGGTVGIQWGFFIAFLAAGALAAAGWRLRDETRDPITEPEKPPPPAVHPDEVPGDDQPSLFDEPSPPARSSPPER